MELKQQAWNRIVYEYPRKSELLIVWSRFELSHPLVQNFFCFFWVRQYTSTGVRGGVRINTGSRDYPYPWPPKEPTPVELEPKTFHKGEAMIYQLH